MKTPLKQMKRVNSLPPSRVPAETSLFLSVVAVGLASAFLGTGCNRDAVTESSLSRLELKKYSHSVKIFTGAGGDFFEIPPSQPNTPAKSNSSAPEPVDVTEIFSTDTEARLHRLSGQSGHQETLEELGLSPAGPVPEQAQRTLLQAEIITQPPTNTDDPYTTHESLGSTSLAIPAGLDGALIIGAAHECGLPWRNQGLECQPDHIENIGMLFEELTPQNGTIGCGYRQQRQELLLCMAGKLVEVADALDPIVWKGLPGGGACFVTFHDPTPNDPSSGDEQKFNTNMENLLPPGPWVFPVQRAEDRFILREQALRLISSIALEEALSTTVLSSSFPGVNTCEALMTAALNDLTETEYNGGVGQFLFEHLDPEISRFRVPGQFPPPAPIQLGPTFDNLRDNVEAMLSRKAETFRAAGRLLREGIIERMIQDDIAGGFVKKGTRLSARSGLERLWGYDIEETELEAATPTFKYNNLRHAARVLYSAWDNDVFPWFEIPEFKARSRDIAAETTHQAEITQLLGAAGILLPITETLTTEQTRQALLDQLVEQEALNRSITIGSPEFADFQTRSTLSRILGNYSDADLRFGLNSNLLAYSQLTSQDPDALVINASDLGGGLSTGHVASSLAALGGATILNGVPRGAILTDVSSRLGYLDRYAAQLHPAESEIAAKTAEGGIGEASTSAFNVAALLQRRLVANRMEALRMGFAEDSAVVHRLQQGATEFESWVGPGRVAISSTASAGLFTEFDVTLLGFNFEELGIQSSAAVETLFGLASGPPWVADCAAGSRTDCPPNFLEDYVVFPSSFSVLDPDDDQKRILGQDGLQISLTFPGSGSAPKFNPELPSSGASPSNNVYLVTRSTPETPDRGQLLVTFGNVGARSYIVSRLRRQLANSALGISDRAGSGAAEVGGITTGRPKDYCIPGIAHDMFVPLEQELTSDNDEFEDSWQHYLSAAEEAANRTDALADRIVDLGLRREEQTQSEALDEARRREAAHEEFADICGYFGDLEGVSFENGLPTFDASFADDSARLCVEEPMFDFVFLSEDRSEFLCGEGRPLRQTGESQVDCLQREVLGCLATDTRPACQKDILEYTALNLIPVDEGTEQDSTCDELAFSIGDMISGDRSFSATTLSALASHELFSPEGLNYAAGQLSTHLNRNGEWQLLLGNLPIADSTAGSSLWPGCLFPQGDPICDPSDSAAATSVRLLHALFTDGSIAGSTKMELLWRVQGALWALAALSGTAPEGLFRTQYPVAVFQKTSSAGIVEEFDFPAEFPAVFGSGEFVPDPGDPTSLVLTVFGDDLSRRSAPGSITKDDQSTLGTVHSIPESMPSFEGQKFEYGAALGLPSWVSQVYSNRQLYMHTEVDSPPVWFGNERTKSQLESDFIRILEAFNEARCEDGFDSAGTAVNTSGETVQLTPNGLHPNLTVGGLFTPPGGRRTLEPQIATLCPHLSTGTTNYPGFLHLEYGLDANGLRPGGADATFYSLFRGSPLSGELPESREISHSYFLAQALLGYEITGHSPAGLYECPATGDTQKVPRECAANFTDSLGFDAPIRFLLSPTECPPSDRALGIVNTYPPMFGCEVATYTLGGLALGCMATDLGVLGEPDISQRPPLNTVDDLKTLEIWFRTVSRQLRHAAARLVLEGIPKRALVGTDIGADTSPVATPARGVRAVELAQLGANIRTLATHWNTVSDNLNLFANDINRAHLELELIDELTDAQRDTLRDAASPWMDIGLAAGAVALTILVPPAGASVDAALVGGALAKGATESIAALSKADNAQSQLDTLAKTESAQVGIALATLNGEAIIKLGGVRDGFKALQDTFPSINTQRDQVEHSQQKATYVLAKALGQPLFGPDGSELFDPLTLLLDQQIDSTRKRYDELVQESRVLAYISRLAIEQRIAMRLEELDTNISSLAPPSSWVDDICILEGHDAEEAFDLDLEEADITNSFINPDEVETFVAALKERFHRDATHDVESERDDLRYIGDYVQRLQDFMTLYAVEFPSRESEDIAVLSVRDDILRADLNSCVTQSKNLLYFSDNLSAGVGTADLDGPSTTLGWNLGRCADEACLVVTSMDGPLPNGVEPGGATWLRDAPNANPPALPPALSPAPGDAPNLPARSTFQRVSLRPGNYVLSWRDLARGPQGEYLQGDPLVEYRVAVLNDNLETIASFAKVPNVGAWSERQVFSFQVGASQAVSVAYYAGPSLSELGSVAIANVQLERAENANALPSAYIRTQASRSVLQGRCESDEEFRAEWAYRCNADHCFHELAHPFAIDTAHLNTGFSPLADQIAAGNFNYRHITTAVNLVGTDIVDCESTPTISCFANAQVEYDLNHDAFDTVLFDHSGDSRHFNFGRGEINHAKALAAERLITSPLGQSDADLLVQPQFTKSEFSGRPLSGRYQIRVYDSPAFHWEQLEDVQLVWQYRYWSRVQKESTN